MYHEFLKAGLKEDGLPWDWTTRGALRRRKQVAGSARVIARARGVWGARGLAQSIEKAAAEWGWELKIEERAADGQFVAPGDLLMSWQGDAAGILVLERPSLNLASYVSGIATQTRALVEAASTAAELKKVSPPRITATRKTLPFYRDIAIQGVLAGGGFSHRVSLSGGVLIKENHIALAGSIAAAVSGATSEAPHGLKIEIEVRDISELSQAIAAQADGVLLDNFMPDQLDEALRLIAHSPRPETWVEVSGGIHVENVAQYVRKGVHVISSGSLTHSVEALDLSLLVDTQS